MQTIILNYCQICLKDLLLDEEGATAIEYGLLAALIGATLIVAQGAVGTALGAMYTVAMGVITGALGS